MTEPTEPPEPPEPPGPPADWVAVPYAVLNPVMINLGRRIDVDVAALLRQGHCWALHSAWDFNGVVWFADDRWHERVSVHHVRRGTYSADTLPELMKIVNNEYGWK